MPLGLDAASEVTETRPRPPCPRCGETEKIHRDGERRGFQKYFCDVCKRSYQDKTESHPAEEWLAAGAANRLLGQEKDGNKTKIPELLVDMRAVWKSVKPPPDGEAAQRVTLRELKETNPKEFLARMSDMEKNLAGHRAALRQARMRHKIVEASKGNEKIEDQASEAVEARLTALLADCRGEGAA